MTKFLTIQSLITGLEPKEIFNHEIKGKRLRKELKGLSDMEPEGFTFKHFEILPAAIIIHITVPLQTGPIELQMRLDYEYPFNQPQIFHVEDQKSPYRYCKDLLPSILQEQIWGPSLTLPNFIESIPELAKKIAKKTKLKWTYHRMFEYGRGELETSGVQLYSAEEYKWDFKVIKNTRKKMIGLAPGCLLVFQEQENDVLKLEFWANISDLREVKANVGKNKYSLEISAPENTKLYLGGPSKDAESILAALNPIQMLERKVQRMEKEGGIKDYDEAVKTYSALVEHYSLTDPAKTEKYMSEMKKVIQNYYDPSTGQDQKMVEIET